MKIFFHTSLDGKDQYISEYKSIVTFLIELGHEVFSDHILKRDKSTLIKNDSDAISHDIENQKKLIQSSQAVIIDSTYPSIGVGYIIAYALEQHKSILILHQGDPQAILFSIKNRLFSFKKYDKNNLPDMRKELKNFLNHTEKRLLKFRFNMMMDEEMNQALTLETVAQKISKADYVRQTLFTHLFSTKKKEI